MKDKLIKARQRAGRFLYGIFAWLAFLGTVIAALISATLVPGLKRRRRWVAAAARGFFKVAAIRTVVRGTENFPTGHCVVVANHASYLDGVILQGFLPPKFSYVIKGEVRKVPVVHFFLRRIGSKFVERFAAVASARDARNLVRAATGGESLAFFPEGTFIEEPGLGKFRPGAFAAAIRGELPLIPVVIRGSRDLMPAGRLLPSHGKLQIDILRPIYPDEVAESNNAELGQLARQRILAVLGEPDLSPEHAA